MSIFSSPAHTTFHIPSSPSTSPFAIQISAPEIQAENLPLSTWTASVILARQLHKFSFDISPFDPTNRRPGEKAVPVVELGAGTGLVGLAAACVWRTRVVLTDLDPIVPGLSANIKLNQPLISQSDAVVECAALDWRNPESLTLRHCTEEHDSRTTMVPSTRKARVILAADVIYDSDHPEMLSRVISEWLECSPQARLCMCWPLRVAYLDEIREMWARLEQGGLICDMEGRQEWEGEKPNGDDEMLCEWSVWRWSQSVLGRKGIDGGKEES